MDKATFTQEITAHAQDIRDFAEKLANFAIDLAKSGQNGEAYMSVGITARELFDEFGEKKERVNKARKLIKDRVLERAKKI